jgi:hypothetical protein
LTIAPRLRNPGGPKALYAQDAVAETPDQGTITGRDQIVAYLGEFSAAFPDAA